MPSITRSPTIATNDSTVGTVEWSNLNNVFINDNQRATALLAAGAVSQYLRVSGFDFSSIPSGAIIRGIRVRVERGFATSVVDESLRLYKTGTGFVGDNKASETEWPGSEVIVTYGGVTDLWGTTWSRDDIVNLLQFGIATRNTHETNNRTPQIDHIQIIVDYELPTAVEDAAHGHAAGKAPVVITPASCAHGHTAGVPDTVFGYDAAHGHTAGKAPVVITPASCVHALTNTNPLRVPVDSCFHYHAATSPSPAFEPGIKIDVDRARSVAAKYGYGDGRWENIVKDSLRAADFPDDSGLVRKLVAQYRFDGRKGDYLQKELTRDVNPSGREEQVILRHVYDHETADRILSFMAGDFRAASVRLDFEGRRQGVLKKNDRVRVTVPSIGLDSDWQVLDFRTREGAYGIGAKRYDPEKYNYAASPELPEDEVFAVLEEFGETPPDPVANFAVSTTYEVKPDGSVEAYFLATWDPPEENYKEAVIYRRKSGDTLWEEIGRGFDRAILSGFVPGLNYDVRIVPWNAAGTTPGTGDVETNITAGGDLTNPTPPSGLTVTSKVGRVIAEWNRHADTKVMGYDLRAWTLSTGGSLITPPGQVFVPQPADSGAKPTYEFQRQKGDLTGALQTWIEIRAVKYNGRVSAYTTRVSATTGGVKRLDIQNEDINQQVSGGSDGGITLGSVMTSIGSAQMTFVGGQDVFVHCGFTLERFAGGVPLPSAQTDYLFWEVRRDDAFFKGAFPLGNLNSAGGAGKPVSFSFDDQPGAGLHKYEMRARNTQASDVSIRAILRKILITEKKR